MNVTNVEAMERCAISAWCSTSLRRTSSAVLFSFRELRNNGDTFQLLSSQLEGLGNRLFVLELNISNTAFTVSMSSIL